MRHARELTAFYAPYVTSYKRYQAGSFAPTGIAWSYDNRTAGFRVVGHGPSLRDRVPHSRRRRQSLHGLRRLPSPPGLDGIEHRSSRRPSSKATSTQSAELPRVP